MVQWLEILRYRQTNKQTDIMLLYYHQSSSYPLGSLRKTKLVYWYDSIYILYDNAERLFGMNNMSEIVLFSTENNTIT